LQQSTSQTSLLTVRDLRHHYSPRASERRATPHPNCAESPLDFGSFNVRSGAILLLRGASGAGKSTLLHLLAGVLPVGPEAGSVSIAGRELSGLSVAQRDRLRPFLVGWMPQRLCLLETLTVRENVLLPLALAGKSDAEGGRRADQLLRSLEIDQLGARRPVAISVGQAARVSLARALVAHPRLLLADEPTAALDADSANLVASALADFVAAGGAAVIASHDADLEDMLCQWLPGASVQTMGLPR